MTYDRKFESEQAVRALYRDLTLLLIEQRLQITTMESCTSGQIASLLTDTEGASAILRGAFVTYSNEAKVLCGVPQKVIDTSGVYSAETAAAMSAAARESMRADLSIGVTGTMGNVDTENRDSVPGQVFFALDVRGEVRVFRLTVPQLSGRLCYKLAVAGHIGEKLLKIVAESNN
ncbi:MAG: CinA family protein [Clostridia bacterium]|nr:CinA family protein [Clostridia bacterium]